MGILFNSGYRLLQDPHFPLENYVYRDQSKCSYEKNRYGFIPGDGGIPRMGK